MTAPAEPVPVAENRRARRNVAVLVAAQAVLGAQMPINAVVGSLAGQTLAENKLFATLPVSVIIVTTMLMAPVMSAIMGRFGRRAGFLLGASSGGVAGLLGAAAMFAGSFAMLLASAALAAVYVAAQSFYRFAAADTASPAFRPKAISWVLAGGLVSAFIGPTAIKLFHDALAPVPFAGAYLAVAALNFAGMWVFVLLDIPRPPRPAERHERGRPLREILAEPRVIVAILCAMVSYALMNLMMTATPLAVVGCGYGSGAAADVVQWHIVAMFAPSFVTGHLIARFGVERIIAVGLAILTCAGLVALSGVALSHFYAALVLLGLGWNFGFIGATTMLASAHRPEERARVQGLNDFLVFGMVAIASLGSGGLLNGVGAGDVVAGWTAVNLAMAPFLALAGGALVWLAIRRPAAA